jgi:YHS domain-containing protein
LKALGGTERLQAALARRLLVVKPLEKGAFSSVAKASEGEHLDPICGRRVGNQTRSLEYKRKRYFFCSEGCRLAFERRAEQYRLSDLARMGALFNPTRVRWGMA